MAKVGKQQSFADRARWRTWLKENHASETEMWLIFYKKHTGKVALTYEEAVEEALCFGWIDGILKRIDGTSSTGLARPSATRPAANERPRPLSCWRRTRSSV